MPGYKHHLVIFSVMYLVMAAILLFYGIDPPLLACGLLIGLPYTLLPDIDIGTSKIRKLANILSLLCILAGFYLYTMGEVSYLVVLSPVLFLLVINLVRHRGVFHTIWMAVLLSAPLYLIRPPCVLFGIYAYSIHLLADWVV